MKIDDKGGKYLLEVARKTLEARFSEEKELLPAEEAIEFLEKRASFVTLKKDGQLRGCIGCLSPYESLSKNVATNAVNAAFHDARFPRLVKEELAEISIELSILTPAQRLNYKDSEELLRLLRVGIDGVILRFAGKSATFLPQVWEQLPQPENFLTHLCSKASLPSDIWKTEKVEIDIYQVQSFTEEL